MKEFKLKKREIVDLSNRLTVFSQVTFPGVLKMKLNIDTLKNVVDDLNQDYIKIFPKYLEKDVYISATIGGKQQTGPIPFDAFDIRRCNIMHKGIKEGKSKSFQDAIKVIEEKEMTVFLEELDVSLPVFLVKDKIKIILRDYLEQMIEPVDQIVHLNKIGLIINLFENGRKKDAR